MSDDEVDLELLDLLRKSLGISKQDPNEISSDTGVLKDAEFIYNNSIDVFIDMYGTKAAASAIYTSIQERGYSTAAWAEHELHPRIGNGFSEVDMVNFIFTMDLLNFSFWSEMSDAQRYQVDYRGKHWTGYSSLVACLRRALDEGIPITTPRFWMSPTTSDEILMAVFRSATEEVIPLLDQRIAILREAGRILHEMFGDLDGGTEDDACSNPDAVATAANVIDTNAIPITTGPDGAATEQTSPNPVSAPQEQSPSNGLESSGQITHEVTELDMVPTQTGGSKPTDTLTSDMASAHTASTEVVPFSDRTVQQSRPSVPDLSVTRLIGEACNSAGKLVNLLAKHFPSFRDETRFDGRRVHFYKRAQIFVADLWAANNGTGYGEFHDIDHLTMFADYRVPQILTSLGILSYSPPLLYAIKDGKVLPSGHSWEVQLRGSSIWAIELIRREILKNHPEANVNAVLIDFFLYDLAKEKEKEARSRGQEVEKCHRVRSIWY